MTLHGLFPFILSYPSQVTGLTKIPLEVNIKMDFNDYTLEDIKKNSLYSSEDKNAIDKNQHFYKGDHWQNGSGWLGPTPALTDKNAAEVWKRIRNAFVSKNLIKSVTDRLRDAIIAKQPDWTCTNNQTLNQTGEQNQDTKDELIKEAEEILNSWWTNKKAQTVFSDAIKNLILGGYGHLRLFLPPDSVKDGKLSTANIDEAAMAVHIMSPALGQAKLITDKDSLKQAGVFNASEENKEVVEFTFLDENGKTILKVFRDGQGEASSPLSLDRNILIFEMTHPSLITETVRQQNKLANLAETMMVHNLVETGFSEMVLTNATLPGKWVADETAEGGKAFIPDTIRRGAGVVNNFVGVDNVDAQGYTTTTTPGVYFREPSPVDTFIKASDKATYNVYDETRQLHALISGDSTPSGESRIQALADFIISAEPYISLVNDTGSRVLKTVLCLVAELSGKSGRYNSLRIQFKAKLYVGKLTLAERQQLLNEMEKRARSRESVMVELGFDDPTTEIERIKNDSIKQETSVMN